MLNSKIVLCRLVWFPTTNFAPRWESNPLLSLGIVSMLPVHHRRVLSYRYNAKGAEQMVKARESPFSVQLPLCNKNLLFAILTIAVSIHHPLQNPVWKTLDYTTISYTIQEYLSGTASNLIRQLLETQYILQTNTALSGLLFVLDVGRDYSSIFRLSSTRLLSLKELWMIVGLSHTPRSSPLLILGPHGQLAPANSAVFSPSFSTYSVACISTSHSGITTS